MSKHPRESTPCELPVAPPAPTRAASRMSERFGDDWAQFVALIPDWEVQLAGLTKSEIYDQVDALEGLNPLQVLPMSLALFDIVASLAQRFVSSLRVSSFDKILALAESIANDPHYGLHRDDAFERPFRVRPSWEDDAWFRTLLQGRAKLQGLKGDTGGPQILGVSAGAGEGKSHRLMQLQHFRPTKFRSEVKTVTDVEAQLVDVPDVDRFVDITYGMGQGLEFDRKYLGKGIYLRLLLRSMGMSNKGCDRFLSDHQDVLKDVGESKMLEVLRKHFERQGGINHLAIGIDDVHCLLPPPNAAPHLRTAVVCCNIAMFAWEMENILNKACTVLITSQADRAFVADTASPLRLSLPPFSDAVVDFLADECQCLRPTEKPTGENRARLKSESVGFGSAVVLLLKQAQQLGAHTADLIVEREPASAKPKVRRAEQGLLREGTALFSG